MTAVVGPGGDHGKLVGQSYGGARSTRVTPVLWPDTPATQPFTPADPADSAPKLSDGVLENRRCRRAGVSSTSGSMASAVIRQSGFDRESRSATTIPDIPVRDTR